MGFNTLNFVPSRRSRKVKLHHKMFQVIISLKYVVFVSITNAKIAKYQDPMIHILFHLRNIGVIISLTSQPPLSKGFVRNVSPIEAAHSRV